MPQPDPQNVLTVKRGVERTATMRAEIPFSSIVTKHHLEHLKDELRERRVDFAAETKIRDSLKLLKQDEKGRWVKANPGQDVEKGWDGKHFRPVTAPDKFARPDKM